MIGILLKSGEGTSAQQLVIETQFESLDSDTLLAVLNGFENVETGTLLLGLEHRNVQVRLRTLEVLDERDAINHETAERLSTDSDALVRSKSISVLVKLGRPFSEEEVEKILARPDGSDWQGRNIFERYQLQNLKGSPASELTSRIDIGLMYEDAAYFARAERYFAKHCAELRRDVDDNFGTYHEERIRRTKVRFGDRSASLVRRYRDREDLDRKRLTRQGLDILCQFAYREDIQRITGNLRSGYAGTSEADAKYLRKHGRWEDIPLLAKPDMSYLGGNPLGGYEDFRHQTAKAILAMSREHSISELFALNVPEVTLKKTIQLCAESRFSQISDDALFGLLNHESEDVRKAASIKTVRAFSKRRIKTILYAYVSGDKYRYYNVIHWLDLGASMPRDEARKIARTSAT